VAGVVPWSRIDPYRATVQVSESTRGRTFRDAALLLHWVRAHGLQLIPAHRPGVEVAPAATETLRYRVHPSGRAVARLWVIGLRQDTVTSSDEGALLDVTFPDGVTVTMLPASVTAFGGIVDRRLYVEELTAKSGAQDDLAVTFESTTGDVTAYVETVACFEMPRAVLTLDDVDRGLDLETLRPGAAMYAARGASVLGLAEGWGDTRVQRALWSQTWPTAQTTSGTFVDVHPLALPVLPSRRFASVATAKAEWWVYGYASNGTTSGEFRLTAGSGDTSTVAMPTGSSSGAWLARGVIDLDAEDLSDAEGLPSGGQETLQLAFRRTAGAGSVRCEGIHVRQLLA
jgi:hypothetical protein